MKSKMTTNKSFYNLGLRISTESSPFETSQGSGWTDSNHLWAQPASSRSDEEGPQQEIANVKDDTSKKIDICML
jgi:hypothetical protein